MKNTTGRHESKTPRVRVLEMKMPPECENMAHVTQNATMCAQALHRVHTWLHFRHNATEMASGQGGIVIQDRFASVF